MAGECQVEVIPWRATQALHNSKRHACSLAALGSDVVAHYDVDALLQPHKLARTGARISPGAASPPTNHAQMCKPA